MHERKYKLSDVKFAQFKIINHFSITCAYHINFGPNIITKIYVAINMLNESLNNIHNIIAICVKLKWAVILSQSAAVKDYNVNRNSPKIPLSCNVCSSESRQFRFAKSLIPAICLRLYGRSHYSKITLSNPNCNPNVWDFEFRCGWQDRGRTWLGRRMLTSAIVQCDHPRHLQRVTLK